MTYTLQLLIVLFFGFSSLAQAETLKTQLFLEASEGHDSLSYTSARKALYNDLYLQRDAKGYFIEGVYCEKKYYPFNGEHPGERLPNSNVFNTEHTWPQSKFSREFPKGVQKTDLHHLYPTFSRINSERGHLPFAEVNERKELFCEGPRLGNPITGDQSNHFELPHSQKGNTARAMFYFSVRYKMAIDPTQEHYLRLWHIEDPVDEAERVRHQKIFKLQGNINPFILDPNLVEQVTDF